MVLYKCDRCGYTTVKTHSFKYHLNRKYPCKIKYENKTLESLKIKYGFIDKPIKKENPTDLVLSEKLKELKIDTSVINEIMPLDTSIEEICMIAPKKNTIITKKENTILLPKNTYICKDCGKEIKYRQNLWRHKKYYCKKELILKEGKRDLVDNQNCSNQIIQNIQINSQTQNIDNSTNIVINNYGSENTKYVTLKKVKQLIEDNYKTAIQELVKYTHFNENFPENHNIAITNIKSKYGYVFNNGVYEIKIVNKLLEDLLERNRQILEKTYDNEHVKKRMKNKHMNDLFEQWLEKMIDNDTLQKLVLDDLYTTIVNLTKKFKINVN